MANPASLMNIDPAIVKSLAEKLPSGPNGVFMTKDLRKFKWEYAVVIIGVIEDLKGLSSDLRPPACLRTALWLRLERFWHVLQFSGVFRHFLPLLVRLQNQALVIDADYLDTMQTALARDLALFGDQAPARLFLSFDEWKLHDTMEMMEEMKLPKGDFHSHVRGIYSRYQDYMQTTARSSGAAVGDFPVNLSPLGYTMMVNAALSSRIQALEERLARLEGPK